MDQGRPDPYPIALFFKMEKPAACERHDKNPQLEHKRCDEDGQQPILSPKKNEETAAAASRTTANRFSMDMASRRLGTQMPSSRMSATRNGDIIMFIRFM